VPPPPGNAGLASIAGIDSDADGVRDDLEQYIASRYPNSARTREALLQLAADFQLATLNRASHELSRARARAIDETISCVVAVSGDYADAVSRLEQEHTNTMERLRAYAEYDDHLLGLSVRLPPEDYGTTACKFSAAALAN
jgi:hypothetical protein